MVFFRATKLEQVMLQQRAKIHWLKGGDQCSRIFFRKVAMRRASKKVFQIANEAGQTLTDQDEVVDEFVSFYQRLLGGERRREYIDLRYLRPWARHVVTPAECMELVQRPTREEVKDAFFDIAEDKAPGPDATPQRLRLVLDAMISPSQNAFVPGRSIGDNILLAQEMFTGYNRQGLPKRCALKVDLRKAYDTVEWDFLIAALQLFGFPDTFIGWIEECVTTPMFSIRMRDSHTIGVARSLVYFSYVLPMISSFFCKPMWPRSRCLGVVLMNSPTYPAFMPTHRRASSLYPVSTGRAGAPNCSSAVPGGSPPPQVPRLSSFSLTAIYLGLPSPSSLKLIVGLKGSSGKLRNGCDISCGKETRQWGIQRWHGVLCADRKERGARNSGYPSTQQSSYVSPSLGCDPRVVLGAGGSFFDYDQHFFLIDLKIGDGECFSLWHDPWHSLGPLIQRFPCGPSRTNIPVASTLSTVIVDGAWCWPLITDMECIEIIHVLPTIHNGSDSILWRGGDFSTKAVYDIFRSPGPKVGWYSLLLGPCKIPKYSFVLWLAILEKLSTMDKPWLSRLGGVCVLCGRAVETHEHLFFRCSYSRRCIRVLKSIVLFSWPNRAWGRILLGLRREYVRSVWPAVKTITATSNGFYFFKFKTEIAMEEVIEGGPWLFQGQPIVLQRWEPGMVLRKHKHTQVPVWIRLRHLPVEFWTDEGLSTVASGVGRRYIKIPSLEHARD
ncbi:hypothetical protein Sango_2974900 [Sesamum angolense]|uniref:Reverse transcriptase domain-containing protein n=1 Tax=Sesamum angolense TaxID=2727404 RepID=A0AAE1VZP4_9LAMI|nr:hypothetical protein Sango_2974900 [Sesamum angolense]